MLLLLLLLCLIAGCYSFHGGQRIVRLRQGENLPTRALYKGDLTEIVASKVEIIQSKNDTIRALVLHRLYTKNVDQKPKIQKPLKNLGEPGTFQEPPRGTWNFSRTSLKTFEVFVSFTF